MEDHDPAKYEAQAVSMNSVLTQLNSKRTVGLFFLDCCRTTGPGAGGGGMKSNQFGRSDAQLFIGLACEPGGAALEGREDDNGVYTAALLRHLPVPGERLVDTMMEVSKEVQQSTGQRQKPVEVRAGLTKKVVLVTPAMVVERVVSLIPEARAELELSEEEEADFQRRLRGGWASLVDDFVDRQEINLRGRAIPLPLMHGSTEATRQGVRRLLLDFPRYRLKRKAIVRLGFDRDSAQADFILRQGEEIVAFEKRTNDEGIVRVWFGAGWTSVSTANGLLVLEEVRPQEGVPPQPRLEPEPEPEPEPDGTTVWARPLSSNLLTFSDGNATAFFTPPPKTWRGGPWGPAALVAVPRGLTTGFSVAVVVEAMHEPQPPDSFGHPSLAQGFFSFGVGSAMDKEDPMFPTDPDGGGFGGYTAVGTCGLVQTPSNSYCRWRDCGRRADRDDKWLYSSRGRRLNIVQGSVLGVDLSPRDAGGRRTARFLVDGSPVAVFVDIEDDGGSSDWVAGALLPSALIWI
eukprot:COSAG04_NODE_664_length_11441_cov_5.400458_8_plen_516_part_00